MCIIFEKGLLWKQTRILVVYLFVSKIIILFCEWLFFFLRNNYLSTFYNWTRERNVPNTHTTYAQKTIHANWRAKHKGPSRQSTSVHKEPMHATTYLLTYLLPQQNAIFCKFFVSSRAIRLYKTLHIVWLCHHIKSISISYDKFYFSFDFHLMEML